MIEIKRYTEQEIQDIIRTNKEWECSYCHRIATKDNNWLHGPYLSLDPEHRDIIICNSCK